MVIYLFLVFIIVVLAYMYCTERKIAERYKEIAHEFDKEVKDLQKECQALRDKINELEKQL